MIRQLSSWMHSKRLQSIADMDISLSLWEIEADRHEGRADWLTHKLAGPTLLYTALLVILRWSALQQQGWHASDTSSGLCIWSVVALFDSEMRLVGTIKRFDWMIFLLEGCSGVLQPRQAQISNLNLTAFHPLFSRRPCWFPVGAKFNQASMAYRQMQN